MHLACGCKSYAWNVEPKCPPDILAQATPVRFQSGFNLKAHHSHPEIGHELNTKVWQHHLRQLRLRPYPQTNKRMWTSSRKGSRSCWSPSRFHGVSKGRWPGKQWTTCQIAKTAQKKPGHMVPETSTSQMATMDSQPRLWHSLQ